MYTTASSTNSSIRSFLINPLRILEYMLSAICLVIHIYCSVCLNIIMTEVFKNLVYVTACSFLIIISHDLVLTCVKKPLDQNTWLPFCITATILFAICAGMSVLWELTSYIKWVYFAIAFINALIFGMDSLSILWQFKKRVRSRSILPSERPSSRPSITISKKPEDDISGSMNNPALPPDYLPITIQRPTPEFMHSVAIQCDSIEQMDLSHVHSSSRYIPLTHQQHTVIPETPPTTYSHYHKRKRHGCHGCHACDPITNVTNNYNTPPSPSAHMGGNVGINRPATTTSTYGGTFHVSKDIAPLSSPAGSAKQGMLGNSAHKMKSPWTNESLYVWEAKPTKFGDEGDDLMKRY